MITIKKLDNADEKTRVTLEIMNALPEWFSPPVDIVNKSVIHKEYPFIAVCDGSNAIGFAALKIHNQYTAEIYNLGILKEYHRMGIGHQLIEACVQYCEKNHYKFLTVTTFWDEENPCLFMVKIIDLKEKQEI